MANVYDQFFDPKPPGAPPGNPYDTLFHGPVADEQEQDVISRVNNPLEATPRNFGFVEVPATIANEFWRPIVQIPGEVGTLVQETGELAESMEGKSTLDIAQQSFMKRLAKNISEGDDGIKGLVQTLWGVEKDVILSALPKEAPVALQSYGKAMVEQNDEATNFLLGAPKKGLAADIGTSSGSVARSIGAWYATGTPAGAGAMMGLAINSDAYKEARAGGKDPEDAAVYAFSQAYLQGKLESIGTGVFTAILHGSSFFKKVLFRSAEQGLEEASQATVEETLADVADVRDLTFDQKLHNILYQGALGLIVGAPTSVVFTKMEDASRGYGIDPKEIKGQIEAFLKNKDNVVEAAGQIIGKEASRITRSDEGSTEAMTAMRGVIAEQEAVETAIAEGSTQDPAIAAKVLLQSPRYSEAQKDAVRGLPQGFTIEQLQQAAGQPIPDMTVEASSVQSLKRPNKLVDAQGIELVMYRGSNSGSFEFDRNAPSSTDAGNMGVGRYASPSTTVARASGDDVRQIDMRLENPVEIVRDNNYIENVQTAADKLGVTVKPQWSGSKQISKEFAEEFTAKALAAGHDGAIARMPNGDIVEAVQYTSGKEKTSGDGSEPPTSPPAGGDGGKRAQYQAVLDAEKNRRTIGEKAADLGEDIQRMMANALVPISTRLKNISEKLKSRLREHEFILRERITEDQKTLEPFLRKYNKLSPEDQTILDFAMKNGDVEIINEIAEANGMTDEISAIRKMLNDIYKRAENVGLEIGYQKNYFPRHVVKPEKLIAFFRGTDEWGQISEAIREKERELGAPLDADAKAELINTVLRGYGKAQITLAKPGNLKERRIDQVTPEINQYYNTTDQALLRYVTAINTNIETRRFLGKGSKTAGLYDNINDSIGWFVMQEMADGNVKPAQEAELTEILQARFKQGRMGDFWRTYKNVEYISTMGSPISAITQMGDLAFSMYKNGIYRTLKTLPKAIAGKSKVTRADLGIDEIAQEFADQSTTGKAVNTIFKLTGFDKMDRLGKETLINGALERYQTQAKNPTEAFRQSLEVILGDETDATIEDLKAGKITRNVKLLLFNELLDIQPVALSEMPASYLKMGNGRILYMLKTFTIKQFDVYRNEVFSQLRENPVQGMKNLTRLLAFFVMMNAGADFLKDLLLGRETEPDDMLVNNLFRIAGVSKFQVYTARREGLGSAAGKTILPPFSVIDAGYKDMAKLAENGELDVEDMQSVKNVPLGGKFYYWWMGAGAEKQKSKSPWPKQ